MTFWQGRQAFVGRGQNFKIENIYPVGLKVQAEFEFIVRGVAWKVDWRMPATLKKEKKKKRYVLFLCFNY